MRKNVTKTLQPEVNRLKRGRETWVSSPECMDLQALTEYACVSDRTLRTWIHLPVNPLPAVQVLGKLLVNRRVFDAWLERHAVSGIDLSATVGQIVTDVLSRR